MKCIPLSSCRECPHRDHRGALARLAYIPTCGLMECRELPYTAPQQSGRVHAIPTYEIPDWCPLPDMPQPAPAATSTMSAEDMRSKYPFGVLVARNKNIGTMESLAERYGPVAKLKFNDDLNEVMFTTAAYRDQFLREQRAKLRDK